MKRTEPVLGTENKVTERELKLVDTVTPLWSCDHFISWTPETKSHSTCISIIKVNIETHENISGHV